MTRFLACGLCWTLACGFSLAGEDKVPDASAKTDEDMKKAEIERISLKYAGFEREAHRAAPRDGFRVLNDPKAVAPEVAEKAGHIQDRMTIVGIVLEDEARAYSIPTLGWHELVNDTVGKVPIAASW